MTRSIISKRRRRRLRGKRHDFSWTEAFAPRSDLPAAESMPVLKRGSIGRRPLTPDDFGRRLLEQKGAVPQDVDLEF